MKSFKSCLRSCYRFLFKLNFNTARRAEIQLPGGPLTGKNSGFQFSYHRPGEEGNATSDTPGEVVLENNLRFLSRFILFKFSVYELETMLRAGFFTNAAG